MPNRIRIFFGLRGATEWVPPNPYPVSEILDNATNGRIAPEISLTGLGNIHWVGRDDPAVLSKKTADTRGGKHIAINVPHGHACSIIDSPSIHFITP